MIQIWYMSLMRSTVATLPATEVRCDQALDRR